MRRLTPALVALGAACAAIFVSAQTARSASPPLLELVKYHVDLQLAPDGSYTETQETVYRLLTEASVQALRQTSLSYTEGYQNLAVLQAYTLKANGTRIDVPKDAYLKGYGANSAPGFEDLKTIQLFFPNVEVGDEIVLTTAFTQIRPWFQGQFSQDFLLSPLFPTDDASFSLTAPASLNLQFDNIGLLGGDPQTANGQTRRTWTYRNSGANQPESGVVSPMDTGPRIVASTFTGYGQVAELYRAMIHGKADVTPEVKAQADQIVAGISDRRAQARAIYEWVSMHIAYVDIVLGAGGFVPHEAAQVLATKYGDCKDHVVLLTSLLAAEGILSQPLLIEATNRYTLPKAASPFVFNHLINYLPEFSLYLDSTARYAPFGELPLGDAGKPVLNVMTGEVVQTPMVGADQSKIRGVENVAIARDGSLDGETHVSVSGPGSVSARAVFQLVNGSNESALFRQMLGPGASGSIDKGNVSSLADPYEYTVHFHVADALSMPGPAAFSPFIGYQAGALFALVGGDLPPERTLPYVCASQTVTDDVTVQLPAGMKLTAVPDSHTIKTEGVMLDMEFDRTAQDKLHIVTTLRLDHPRPTCDAAYYARVRPKLAEMITALRGQVVYRLRDEK